MQQLLVESGVLAFLGGVLGIGLTVAGIQLFLKLAGDFPNPGSISIDGRVLLFTIGLSGITAILFGSAPALRASRPDLNTVIREGDRSRVAGSRGWTRHGFAVSEVALAMVLLVGAGLMIDTVLRLKQVNPGFDSRNVMTAQIALPEGGKYVERVPGGDMEKVSPLTTTLYQRLLESVDAFPGVESAGIVSQGLRGITFSIMGRPVPAPDHRPEAGSAEMSPAYFHTLRIPLKKGRYLTESDRKNTPWAAVINETFARRYFPNEDPIGQRLLLRYESYHIDEERPREIVGIVGDVKQYGLAEKAPPVVYSSFFQQAEVYPGGCISVSHRADDCSADGLRAWLAERFRFQH